MTIDDGYDDLELDTAQNTADALSPAGQGWRQNKAGRWYLPRRGASGMVWRQGNETPEEAHARDARDQARPKDKRPGGASKPKAAPTAPKAPAPTQTDLKELEFLIAEALKSPSMVCMAFGDEWPANHMITQAPVFARNLTHAAAHNPWLRQKLEAMVTGEDFMIKLVTTGAVFSAGFMYLAPVLIYYLDPGFVPPQVKGMLEIPNRQVERAKNAAVMEEALRAQAAEAAEAARAAQGAADNAAASTKAA